MKYIFFLLSFFLLASTAYPTETCKKCTYDLDYSGYQKTYDGKAIIPHPRVTYEDSSEVFRHKKMFYGHVSFGLIAFQAELSYFLNPDTLVGINYMYQKDNVVGVSQLYTVSATRFVSDTLYLRGGLGHRVGDIVNYLNSLGKTQVGLERTTDTGVEIGIGNRWQFENISLGGEWFAIYIPLIIDKEKTFDFQFRIMMMQVGVAF